MRAINRISPVEMATSTAPQASLRVAVRLRDLADTVDADHAEMKAQQLSGGQDDTDEAGVQSHN